MTESLWKLVLLAYAAIILPPSPRCPRLDISASLFISLSSSRSAPDCLFSNLTNPAPRSSCSGSQLLLKVSSRQFIHSVNMCWGTDSIDNEKSQRLCHHRAYILVGDKYNEQTFCTSECGQWLVTTTTADPAFLSWSPVSPWYRHPSSQPLSPLLAS